MKTRWIRFWMWITVPCTLVALTGTAAIAAPALPPKQVVTWSVDFSEWPVPHSPRLADTSEVIFTLSFILGDERGWKRGGLIFRYVPEPRGGQIVFLPTDQTRVSRACGQSAIGCAVYSDATRRPGDCRVFYSLAYAKSKRLELKKSLINHEVGHCFRFEHTDSGVMRQYPLTNPAPTPADFLPSDAQVAEAMRFRMRLA